MKIAKKLVDIDAQVVTFDFADGETLPCPVDELPRDIVNRLALHGIKQKVGDSYASADEKGWSVADCRDEARRVWDNLKAGVFNAKGGGTGVTILAEAIARLTGKATDAAVIVVNGMSDEQRKELERRPDVKAMVLTIKAERAEQRASTVAGGDTDDLKALF